LAGWPPISVFRSLALIANSRGNLVHAVEGTAWDIRLHPNNPRDFELSFSANTDATCGRDDVARALCKVAVETRWLHDAVDARSSRWDAIAAAAIGGPLPEGAALGLVHPESPSDIDLTPYSEVLVDDDPGPLRIACRLDVVGLRLLLIVGALPPALPNTGWWVVDPQSGTLIGPSSTHGRFRGTAESAQKLSGGLPPHRPGKSSRLPTHRLGAEIQVMCSAGTASRPSSSK
jgi:hypothetical protein